MRSLGKVELLDPNLPTMELGESPLWDEDSYSLYWVDIEGHAIHRYQMELGQHSKCSVGDKIGFCALDGEWLLCGMRDGLYKIDFNNKTRKKIKNTAIPALLRFNDGKKDAQGRLWAGTIPLDKNAKEPVASLYRLDVSGLAEIETGLFISNGVGWSPDGRFMYHIDTGRKTVWRYDYDTKTGQVSGRYEFLQIQDEGSPDGMCVDKEGRLYIAMFGGSKILIFSADATSHGEITLPVPNVTSCALGQNELFITTARKELSEAQLKEAPLSGQIFKARLTDE